MRLPRVQQVFSASCFGTALALATSVSLSPLFVSPITRLSFPMHHGEDDYRVITHHVEKFVWVPHHEDPTNIAVEKRLPHRVFAEAVNRCQKFCLKARSRSAAPMRVPQVGSTRLVLCLRIDLDFPGHLPSHLKMRERAASQSES